MGDDRFAGIENELIVYRLLLDGGVGDEVMGDGGWPCAASASSAP